MAIVYSDVQIAYTVKELYYRLLLADSHTDMVEGYEIRKDGSLHRQAFADFPLAEDVFGFAAESTNKFWHGRAHDSEVTSYTRGGSRISSFNVPDDALPIQGLASANGTLFVLGNGTDTDVYAYGATNYNWPVDVGVSALRVRTIITVPEHNLLYIGGINSNTMFAYTLAGVRVESMDWTFAEDAVLRAGAYGNGYIILASRSATEEVLRVYRFTDLVFDGTENMHLHRYTLPAEEIDGATCEIANVVDNVHDIAWSIRKVVVDSIHKDYQVAWSIRKLVGRSRTIAYGIRKPVGRSRTIAYGIRKPIHKDYQVAWSIRNLVGRSRMIAYGVRKLVTKDWPIVFSIRKRVVSDKLLAWSIRKPIYRDWKVAYGIRNLIGKSYTLAYVIRQLVFSDVDLAYVIKVLAVHGAATEKFMRDLVTMIGDDVRWGGAFGAKPSVDKKYDRKVLGYGKSSEEVVLIHSAADRMSAFGLGTATNFKAWRHDVSATIEIMTNLSSERFEKLVNNVVDILKRNVAREGYVQITASAAHNESDELRNMWRAIIDVEAILLDP